MRQRAPHRGFADRPYRTGAWRALAPALGLVSWLAASSGALAADPCLPSFNGGVGRLVPKPSDATCSFDGGARLSNVGEVLPLHAASDGYGGFFSPRILERSLKGFELDLRPGAGAPSESNSLALLVGTPKQSGAGDPHGALFSGVAWQAGDARWGRWGLDLVHSRSEDGAADGYTQTVISASAGKDVVVGDQVLSFEGEAAHLVGDPAATAPRRAADDNGIFARLAGHGAMPLTYHLTYERYGDGFRPAGGAVHAGRQAIEGEAAWRFSNGLRLDGRLRSYRDRFESDNPLDTELAALHLSGPLFASRLSGLQTSLEAVVSRAAAVETTAARLSHHVSASFSALVADWKEKLAMSWESVASRPAGGTPTGFTTQQLTVGGTRSLAIWGLSGSLTPELMVRNVNGGSGDGHAVGPSLGFALSDGSQRLHLRYKLLQWDRHAPGAFDSLSTRMEASYSYSVGCESFSAAMAIDSRHPGSGPPVADRQIKLSYALSF